LDAKEILQKCTVDGLIVRLPDIGLERKLYIQVKNALDLIGGTWKGGKTQGFVFKEDPTELLAKIAGGDKVNLKKEYQFFPTPDAIADQLVELAEIPEGWHGLGKGEHRHVLEPSAGQGAILDAIARKCGAMEVYGYELMDINRTILKDKYPKFVLGAEKDFLTSTSGIKFDRIIANPPFAKNQDIDHVYKMFDVLAEGGKIVTIVSPHWKLSSNKKETEFREWLEEVGAAEIVIPAGTFKESGTNIETIILIIEK